MFTNIIKIVLCLLFFNAYTITETFAKISKFYHSKDEISNYFLGSLLFNAKQPNDALIYFDKVNDNMTNYDLFNQKYIETLVNLGKFNKAFSHLRKVNNKKTNLYEFNLLLGIQAFKNNNYILAKKYFKKMSQSKNYTDLLQMNLDNFLLSWTYVALDNKELAYALINNVGDELKTIKLIQKTLVDCAFESKNTIQSFNLLLDSKSTSTDFSRYNFFLANVLLHNGDVNFAKKILVNAIESSPGNLLINQTLEDLKMNKISKIKDKFNCQNVNHNVSEFFYLISNLYSSQADYITSNYYFNISNLLNPNFNSNRTLFAENLMQLKQYDDAFKEYSYIVNIGKKYFWHATKNKAFIIEEKKSLKESIIFLENEFKKIRNPNYKILYDLANFYRAGEQYEDAIKIYNQILELVDDNHAITPQIYFKRGSCYEVLKKYDLSDKDLEKSLSLSSESAYVLNYLAYSWLERRINIQKSIDMLEKANDLKKNDPYIIDSLGWGMYLINEYKKAEKLLRTAVEMVPQEAVVIDHYGDVLWKMNRNLQAIYSWKYAYNLEDADQKIKDSISQKLVFGIPD